MGRLAAVVPAAAVAGVVAVMAGGLAVMLESVEMIVSAILPCRK